MKTSRYSKLLVFLLSLGLTCSTFQVASEDIDLFTVDEGNNVNHPNVLIVLDNSANWSRAAQKWPDEPTQGQAEVRAIQAVISALDENINVGLMEYITGGSSGDTDSGFVRFNIKPMTAANKAALNTILDTIYDNINDPDEKRSQGNPFGNLFWDVYNYLSGGDHSNGGAGTPASADSAAYTNLYSKFRSPLTALDSCAQTTVIFLANNTSSGPTGDSAANVSALSGFGGVTTPQIKFRDFNCTATATTTNLGLSTSCYASDAACTSTENNAACLAEGFTSCSCDAASAVPCSSLSHFSVSATSTTSSQILDAATSPNPSTTVTPNTPTNANSLLTCKNPNQVPNISCPGGDAPDGVTTANDPVAGKSTKRVTTWSSCAYESVANASCSGQKTDWEARGTKTVETTVFTTTSSSSTSIVGETSGCYDSEATCSTSGFAGCPGSGTSTYSSCACVPPQNTAGCTADTNKFNVIGSSTSNVCTAGNTFSTPPTQGGKNFMSDEWTRFLSQTGITLPGGGKALVKTHTIDVFNAQQDETMSSLLFSVARVSGGEYYQAKSKNDITAALTAIFAQVQAVNSAFASATLPINATNRTQNLNEVFLGLFKPGRTKQPLWFGNLKKFKLIVSGGEIKLGDANDNPAVNDDTGFLHECAVSEWTTDSGQYWFFTTQDDPDALGTCATTANDVHSDLPDGPFAEKGGAAEVLRKGNTTASPDATSGNYPLTRNIKTLSGGALADFTPPITGIADDFVTRFARGEDTENDDLDIGNFNLTEPRSTIHGDVIHSRPLAITYPSPNGVVIYYGANDGVFRAVSSATGKELWSFVAPEHYGKFARLKNNTPLVKYFGDTAPGLARRDYFFDGSTAIFQNADNSNIRIFTTMRRGGRMVYSFNVTNPTAPTYAWSKGCPNLTNDTGCDAGFEGIGQTWSLPGAAFIKGYPAVGAETPVLIMGGGYDSCEDADTATPTCTSAKGRVIYVLDALTGAIVRSFDLSSVSGTRSIAADMALIDMDNDGFVDHAYAVDTGGNFYRVALNGATLPADPTEWTVQRIAYTNGAGRKFLFTPALVQAGSDIVYLAIGSGDREAPLAAQYPFTTPVTNRAYVFKDNVTAVADPVLSVALTAGFNLDDTSNMVNHTNSLGLCSDEKVLPSSPKKGWFIDLYQDFDDDNVIDADEKGEQTVTSAVIAAGFVFFSTNRPTPDAVATACTNSLGHARGYFMNLFNGAGSIGIAGACTNTSGLAVRSAVFTGGGLPPSPVLATVPIDGKVRTVVIGGIDKHATDAQGTPYTPANPFDPEDPDNTTSPFNPPPVDPIIEATRTPLYWFKSTGDN